MLTSSEACERNKGPILEVLARELTASCAVLEVGSGTGQHAVHFARHLPHLTWQPSEVADQEPALAERIRLEGSANLRAPMVLDVRRLPWPAPCAGGSFDAVFSANTLHIMAWAGVEDFFQGAGRTLADGGVLCVYGPFRYGGRYTSESNADFDAWLRARDPSSGIRDFEALESLARVQGLVLAGDHAMPANNRTLVWRSRGAAAA